MKHWVMDYETLSNCFTGVFEHYKTNESKTFVVHDLRNDFDEFIDFLEENVKNKECQSILYCIHLRLERLAGLSQ